MANPRDIAIDSNGVVFVADWYGVRVRLIAPNGAVTTIAGSGSNGFVDGIGSSASFGFIYGIALDSEGTVYVKDTQRIRKVKLIAPVSNCTGGYFANTASQCSMCPIGNFCPTGAYWF
jgi:hypothetical protein